MTSPEHGVVTGHGDGIRRIIAPNPGPMTHLGTNTWLIGESEIAVIDPGPAVEAHISAILEATRGQVISHILVTHAHADHSPGARSLAARTGAPILGFGPPGAGRSATMAALASRAEIGGGEGVDTVFEPTEMIEEGDRISGAGWTIDVLHTPGHFAGHLSFLMGDGLFSGDHVMEWATTMVSPPDGDVGAFIRTSERLRDMAPSACHTGHGRSIEDPASRLDDLIRHRKSREEAILAGLSEGGRTIPDLTERIYHDVPRTMHPAARRNVLAHLIDLVERNLVRAEPELSVEARFFLD